MDLQISFKHHDTSDAIKTYTTEKSNRLSRYFQGKLHLTWNFSQVRQQWIAACHLVGNNMDFFSEAEADDIHASIDMATDKMEKQLRKHKEIVTNHLHRNHDERTDLIAPGATPVIEEEYGRTGTED